MCFIRLLNYGFQAQGSSWHRFIFHNPLFKSGWLCNRGKSLLKIKNRIFADNYNL